MKNILEMALLGKGMPVEQVVALEKDVQDGKIFAEKEYEFYAELSDLDQLAKADSMDMQEQWTVKVGKSDKNGGKGSLRVRKIQAGDVTKGADQTSDAEIQYVMTTKVERGAGDRLEVPIPVSEDSFDLFKILAEGGMIKHRYHFPTDDGLIFEVDMYLNPEGGYYPVCKIDLEVKDKKGELPAFPFEVKWEINGSARSKELQEKIRGFYDKYFITKNPAVKKEEDPGDHEYRGDYTSDSAKIPAKE